MQDPRTARDEPARAHRLVELYPVIRWAAGVVAGVCFVIAVYEAVVAGGIALWPDAPDRWILPMWIAAATISGLGLTPVRSFARDLIRRLWRSGATDPYTALVSFVSGAATGEVADDALARLAQLAASGTGVRSVAVYLAAPDGGLRIGGQWPQDAASATAWVEQVDDAGQLGSSGAGYVAEVRDGGDLLGALVFHPPSNRPLRDSDLRLADDVANAAGLLLRNADLTARLADEVRRQSAQAVELDRSRRRVLDARDAAREQLGRELQARVGEPLRQCASDTAGLVGADGSEGALPPVEPALGEMIERIDQAIGDFRRIVHGLYPPTLTDHGLAAAVENLLTQFPQRVVFTAEDLPRFAPKVEAGVYFCVAALLDSLSEHGGENVRFHAEVAADGILVVALSDGPPSGSAAIGPVAVEPGVLEAVRDRVAALEGDLEFDVHEGGPRCVLRIPVTPESGYESSLAHPIPAETATALAAPLSASTPPEVHPRRWTLKQLFGRAVAYGVLVVVIGAFYVVGVVRTDALFGLDNDWLAPPQVAAAGLVAFLFHPVRVRAEKWADRLVFGRRIPPYEVLAQVSALTSASGSGDAALVSLARITAQGLGTGTAAVYLDLHDGTQAVYQWPVETTATTALAAPSPQRRIPVEYQGTAVGALSIPGGLGGRPVAGRRAVLRDLARAAGIIMHNAGLTVDLERRLYAAEQRSAQIRASRWRIVAAQDSERRELERDLHDGAQPGLTAIRFALGLIAHLVRSGKDQAARESLGRLREQIDAASAGLHQILRGLDPPALTNEGIVPALRELAESLGTVVTFHVGAEAESARFSAQIEAAVYFCSAEAIQNTVKHCPGVPVTVGLGLDRGSDRGSALEGNGNGALLRFSVTDRGPGFDTQGAVSEGGGLQNMTDRVNAVAGTLTITSTLGVGTEIVGTVPAVARA